MTIAVKWVIYNLIILVASLVSFYSSAHGVDEGTKQFLTDNQGVALIPFMYIGAKHMLTGYDHLLFLVGVLFFLYRSKDVLIYVSLFTLGHSVTLLFGVWFDIQVNAYIIDAIIGLSVVVLLVLMQKKYGLFMITPNLAYPVEFTYINVITVIGTILILGYLASKIASSRISKKLVS